MKAKKLYSIFLILNFAINSITGQDMLTDRGKVRTLRAYIFCNTEDKTIGKSCLSDSANISMEINKLSNEAGLILKPLYFTGQNYTWNNLNNLIYSLSKSVFDFDILLFYFSSHGNRNIEDKSPFPRIEIPNLGKKQYFDSKAIHDSINYQIKDSKAFFLEITIVDACNSFDYDYSDTSLSENIQLKKKSRQKPTKIAAINLLEWSQDCIPNILRRETIEHYNVLFKDSAGDIMITSSKTGQYSISTDTGSTFTNSLIKQLNLSISDPKRKKETWDEIFGKTEMQLDEDHSPYWIKTQIMPRNPFYKIDPQEIRSDIIFKQTLEKVDGNRLLINARINLIPPNDIRYLQNPYYTDDLIKHVDSVQYSIFEKKDDGCYKLAQVLTGKARANRFSVEFTSSTDFLMQATFKIDGGTHVINTMTQEN